MHSDDLQSVSSAHHFHTSTILAPQMFDKSSNRESVVKVIVSSPSITSDSPRVTFNSAASMLQAGFYTNNVEHSYVLPNFYGNSTEDIENDMIMVYKLHEDEHGKGLVDSRKLKLDHNKLLYKYVRLNVTVKCLCVDDCVCPKRYDLTSSMKNLLKMKVATFAAGFRANSEELQTQAYGCNGSLSDEKSCTGVKTGTEVISEQNEELQDMVCLMLDKFRVMNLDESIECVLEDQKDEMILGLPSDNKINVYSVFCLSVEAVFLKFRKADNSLEQIIYKIGTLQSHLSWRKTRFKRVLSETATKNYSADILKLYDDILPDIKCFEVYIHNVQTLYIVLTYDSHVSSLRTVHAANPRFFRGMDDNLIALAVKRALSGLATIHKFSKHHTRITTGGYAAGYYSYKCVEVLYSDAFSAIEDAGLHDIKAVKEMGQKFRKTNRVASELNQKVHDKGMPVAWFQNIPILVFDP